MTTAEELKEIKLFLALLFPWDAEGEQLWKSVSWTFTAEDGVTKVANYAAQSLDDLARLITTRVNRHGANVYICLGTQKLVSTDKLAADGFPKAVRKHNNMVNYKSIWLDIDVGKTDAYATTDDAFAALRDFCRVSGMPTPTMEVQSGSGGLHVYWCLADPVEQPQWMSLAKGLQAAAHNYGLRFDPQVTVNPAGILRVPNSWNHKRTPPSRVTLYRREGHTFPRYDYAQLQAVLGVQAAPEPPKRKMGAAAQQRSSNFTAGIEGAPPVEIGDLAINCGVFADILDREGNGDSEPLWNQAIYAAAFTVDPREAAHALSRGDPRYSAEETDKKLDEKIAAREANKDRGWPSCESFSMLHSACQTCPLLKLGKSPFNHVPTEKPTSDDTTQAFVASSDDRLMPKGYWRNRHGHVLTLLYNKNGEGYAAEIINYPVLDAGIDPDTGVLLYEAMVFGVAQWREVNVAMSLQPTLAGQALAKGHGLYINPKQHTAARDFLVAWVGHLQNIKKFKSQGSYGWQTGGGFAYGDKIFYSDHVESVFRGKNHDPNFTSCGELKPWQDAMQLVHGNPPLETVVASAFAAPLVEMIGSSSLVLSIFSAQSGVGKTTAMTLGQAVWGHPRSGMSSLADTTNSTMKKISDLKNLPIYWDELRTTDQVEKVVDVVFQVTQGKAKARLNKDISQQEAKTFTTMFIVASNRGIADTVYSQTEATEAGGLRVFEIEAAPLRTATSDADARQLLIPLQENFGIAGAHFAQKLAENRTTVKEVIKRVDAQLGNELNLRPKERFWQMTAVTLLVGAQLANAWGLTNFNIPQLRAYIVAMLDEQRGGMKKQDYVTLQTSADAMGLLRELFNEARQRNMIITERIPYGVIGKPTPNNLVDTDMSRMGNIWIQVGDKDGRIRIGVRQFHMWLSERRINPKHVVEQLRGHFYVTQSKQTIGSGVPGLDALARLGRFACYDLSPLPASVSASSPSHDSDEPS